MAPVVFDDKGMHFTDWLEQFPQILARLESEEGGKEYGAPFQLAEKTDGSEPGGRLREVRMSSA